MRSPLQSGKTILQIPILIHTQLMDLLQEICKEVSLKHTGIKQEPYSAPVPDTHTNQLQQDISQLQTDMQIPKESMNKLRHQYAAL